jgi:hypothetical protein
VLVANARAGKEARNGIASARDELVRNGEVEVVDLAEPATLDEVLDRLGGRTLIVGGGDGTVHSIVQRLSDRHQLDAVTIGLLPLGTGNDFARCLQIPITPVGAAATIRFGRLWCSIFWWTTGAPLSSTLPMLASRPARRYERRGSSRTSGAPPIPSPPRWREHWPTASPCGWTWTSRPSTKGRSSSSP